MKLAAFLFLGLLANAGASSAQTPALGRSPIRFEPKLSVAAPPPTLYRKQRQDQVKPARLHVVRHVPAVSAEKQGDSEIICGLTVIRKGSEFDPGMLVKPSDGAGAAIRRITPPVCTSHR
jgi:hypothetical protein